MITDKKLFTWVLLTLAVFSLAHATVSLAEQPMAEVKNTVERIEAARTNPSTTKVETAQAIRAILLPRFDFTEMAKQSLGSYWKNLDGREVEFVSAFADFVANSYMGTLESYRGEKIVYLRERVDQNLAQVDTRIVMSKGDPLSVSYRLHLMADDWKIYDVVIDDISLVSNFRSQFSRILAYGSFDELLRKMREKG
jgi:phospholipid transport system substrate-binding protein